MYSTKQGPSSSSSGSGGGPPGGNGGDGRKPFSPDPNAGFLFRHKLLWDMSRILFTIVRFWCTIAHEWRIGQVTGVTRDNDVEITVIDGNEIPVFTIYEADWQDVARWLIDPRSGQTVVYNVFDLDNGGPHQGLAQYALLPLYNNGPRRDWPAAQPAGRRSPISPVGQPPSPPYMPTTPDYRPQSPPYSPSSPPVFMPSPPPMNQEAAKDDDSSSSVMVVDTRRGCNCVKCQKKKSDSGR